MFKGVILTDSTRLAKTLGVQPKEILDTIQDFILQCHPFIEWHLADASDELYEDDIDPLDWHTHAQVLKDYYYGLEINKVDNCPLFIIGGEDDVPMPKIKNPCSQFGEEYLYSDMLYCFAEEAEDNPLLFLTESPRFVPGRLPFCMEHTLDDLKYYFKKCIKNLEHGIEAGGVIMTTAESFLAQSATIMQDIPVPSLSEEYVPLNNRMIVSPLLDTVNPDMYDGYVHELKKSNFLVCNLHGSPKEEEPYFSGEDKDCSIPKPIAIQPSMLSQTAPNVFNTIACYGGRFIDYSIDESMLYSALLNGTMIFTGSCDLALGNYDRAGCSELLIRLYNTYLLQGKPAGMALMQAKRHYYNTFHIEDEDDNAMYTILEFNLFGCPITYVSPMLSQTFSPSLLGHRIQTKGRPTYKPSKYISEESAYQAEDIFAYVRNRVDNNLSQIRTIIEKEVYQRLGLRTQDRSGIYQKIEDGRQVGWRFVYSPKVANEQSGFSTNYYVEANIMGKITSIILTK